MSKKILCLILCLAMLMTAFGVTAVAAVDESKITDGYTAIQTFDGKSEDFVIGSYGEGTVNLDTGEMDITVDPENSKAHLVSNEKISSSSFVIEFDVTRKGDFDIYEDEGYKAGTVGFYGISVAVKKSANADYAPLSKYGVLLPVTTNAIGETYRYRIVVDEDSFRAAYDADFEEDEYATEIKGNSKILSWGQKLMKVYYMEPGATKYTATSPVSSHAASTMYTHKPRFFMGASIPEGANYPDAGEVNISFYAASNLPKNGSAPIDFSTIEFSVDNLKVYSQGTSFADNIRFKDENGDFVNEIPQGEVTPVFEMVNNGGISDAVAISAVYDADDNMVNCNTAEISDIAEGVSEITGATVDATNGVRVEAFLWDSENGMIPMGAKGYLGEAAVVEASETTANLGTDGETKINSFLYFDRSTSGNTVTVEGVHSSEEKTSVAITVKGDNNGKVLATTQVKTKADGSFKTVLTINPELVEENETATVTVSGIDTTKKSFSIPVKSNWADMADAFDAISNAETAESFYNTYKDNFGYYKSGEDTLATVDISGLDEIDFANIAFIKSLREYDGLTYGEIANEAIALIEALAEVDEFMNGFADAKALSTDAEKIQAIKTLTENCSFLEFSTEGVSNVDAICKEMLASDAETISDFYKDFVDAYNAQKTAEEKSVPDFTSVSSVNGMKSFFENYKTVLGIDASEYATKDYAVMFSAYKEKEFDGCSDYGQVNDAIAFLMNYVAEYNELIKAVEDAESVTDEWNAVKAILSDSNEYVTATLADAYIFEKESNEETVYKRVKDMGYDSLADVAAKLDEDGEETAAKAKCLDDITEAANEKMGTGTGRWSIIEEQVQLAIKENWISPDISGKVKDEVAVYKKMAKKNFSYLPDIETIYEEAYAAQIKEEKKSSTGGGGGGGGFGGTGSGSDGKVTSGNTGASDDKEVINMSSDLVNVETTVETNKEDHPEAPFKDVTDEYKWASAGIHGLRKYGLVNGDGNGNFRPAAGITREEFLKILLNVFAIDAKGGNSTFTDVDNNAWYAEYVATAADMGIVKGYADGRFGVGDTISRADMAVMIYRTMTICEISVDPTEEGFMFKDVIDIPDYARDSISILQQAGVLNGDTFGYYKPLDNVTRAEASVALWTVHDAIKDIVKYSWTNPY